jgi:hypothetical protein
MSEGPIYNLFPTLAGTIRKWMTHLPRMRAMGLHAVYKTRFNYPIFREPLRRQRLLLAQLRFRAGEADD